MHVGRDIARAPHTCVPAAQQRNKKRKRPEDGATPAAAWRGAGGFADDRAPWQHGSGLKCVCSWQSPPLLITHCVISSVPCLTIEEASWKVAPRPPRPGAGGSGLQMTGRLAELCPVPSAFFLVVCRLCPHCPLLLLLLLSLGAGAPGTALLGVMGITLELCLLSFWVCSGGVRAFEAVCGPGTAAL